MARWSAGRIARRKMADNMKHEIPAFLSHLKKFNGYPVPFTQVWIDGKLDFRAVDPARTLRCVKEKLCAICGQRLGEKSCFIGGPLSKTNRLFTDPPMH